MDDASTNLLMDLKSNLPPHVQLVSRIVHERLARELNMESRRLHVAVLDDDQSVRVALSRLLNASDMAAESFATCMELFSSVANTRPDCLVLDLHMPGMDGIEVMNYLNQTGIHIPTVIITANEEASTRDACFKAGAAVYLRKPLDAGELLTAIADAVTAEQSGPTPR